MWALVWRASRPAAFITHIYVDDAVSLRGGHEIWGLPKQRASFTWDAQGVRMAVDGAPCVRLDFAQPHRGLPLPVLIHALGCPAGVVRPFFSFGWMQAAPRRVRVEIDAVAPFARFGLERPLVGMAGPWVDLRVQAPRA